MVHAAADAGHTQVEPRVGGRFEMFGGAVKGAFTALESPGTICLSWRFANWPDGATSKVLGVPPRTACRQSQGTSPGRLRR